jgi:XapX domain-containing protein
MKVLFVSFLVGLIVGVLYGVIRVKSPAPPIVALVGLLGMVLGEQVGGWVLAKKISFTHAASVCLVAKHWDQSAGAQPVVEAQPQEEH